MFPLPISTYLYSGLILINILCFGYGRYEHNNYVAFKTKTEALATIQEAENASKIKQQELINRGIANEYQAKLSALKSYYTNSLRPSGSSAMPSLSNPASGVNESASNQLLACAYTTQQLISLQDWIKEQSNVK